MDPNRLVKLMGHNSKQMVYEVYGANTLRGKQMIILQSWGI